MSPTLPPLPRLRTLEEVSHHLRVCTKTVLRKIKAGELKAVRVGKQYRITDHELRAYLARHE